MKCISYKQPWASLVILREKRMETRSRNYTVLGGRWHAVHASSTWKADQRKLMTTEPFAARLAYHGITAGNAVHEIFPRGAILGVAFVGAIVPSDSTFLPGILNDQERAFGNYDPGRWVNLLGDVFQVARPIQFTARLGVFDLPAEVEHQVLLGLQGNPNLPAELTSDALLDEALALAEQRDAKAAEVQQLLARVNGRGRDTRTPIDRMIDQAVGRG